MELKLCESIDDCVKELDGYTGYGDMVIEAQTHLKRLKEIILDPTPAGIEEGIELSKTLKSMISPYYSYVPRVALTSQKIVDWMQTHA